ncbi:hypothetical protein BD779DRAFT_1552097 [Infundibulicybe gibba]|nr:hypothetical protein BD779DRAFT_1552097 [Infundibulicybe gibba]
MPGKHVHFSRRNTYHSPPTPALSSSNYSPASSSGPLTPPQHPSGRLPGPSPYAISFPPTSHHKHPMTIHVHPLLSSPAIISYDVTLPASTISTKHRQAATFSLSEPATNPPLRSMTVTSPHLPWSIKIYPSRHSVITVSDVLQGIYSALRTNLSASDFYALPTHKDQRRATAAYEARYRRMRGTRAYDEEKRGGLKRVDYLMDNTRFAGLTASHRGSESFTMHVTT